jgi:CheY-like chemotaxis protein
VRFDLTEVGSGLVTLLTRLMPPGIRVELPPATTRLWVLGDRSMFEQVVMNLVINARDAMPAGGRITLTTTSAILSSDEAAGVSRGGLELVPGPFAVLRVSDTGAGIAPEHEARLFEPFFTTKAEGKGTGLGLSTVFAIAQQHRGYIRVLTTSPAGTTFEFGVPLLEESPLAVVVPAPLETSRLRDASSGTPPVVLLAEDHEEVRRMMQRILEREGWRVLAATTGPEALALWDTTGPVTLLLTDLEMPGGMHGTELADELLRRQPGLRVIYTSGVDPTLSDSVGRFVVGENFLPKPAPVAEMLRMVKLQLAFG